MDYTFPVCIEGIKTETGLSVPGKKALVRTDTSKVLCLVSDKIRQIKTHKETVEEAEKLFSGFGPYKIQVFLSKGDLIVRVVGIFKDIITVLANGVEIQKLLMVEHTYETIDMHPTVYVGGFIKKSNTWFVNPTPVTKLIAGSEDVYWSNLADNRINKRWEQAISKWGCWDSCCISYERAVAMIRSGIPGILTQEKNPYVIKRLKTNVDDDVSIWDLYYTIARAILSEEFSSIGTKLKKIKELSNYIDKKFHTIKEV